MPHRSASPAIFVIAAVLLGVIVIWYNRRTRRILNQSAPGETRLMAYLVLSRSKESARVTGVRILREWPAFFFAGLAFGILVFNLEGMDFRPGRLARVCGVRRYTRSWSTVDHVRLIRDPLRRVRVRVHVFTSPDASVWFEAEPVAAAAEGLRKAGQHVTVEEL